MDILVDSEAFKEAFKDLSTFFKKSVMDRCILLKVEDNTLSIIAGSGAYYRSDLKLLDNVKGSYKSYISFSDVSAILSDEGVIELNMQDEFTEVKSDFVNMTLEKNLTVVYEKDIETHDYKEFDVGKFSKAVRAMIKLNAVSNIYHEDGTIIFNGPYAQRKFNVMKAQVESDAIVTTMDVSMLYMLSSFLRGTDYAEYAEYSSYIVFKVRSRYLAIPKFIPNNVEDLREAVNRCSKIEKVVIKDFVEGLKKLKAVVGNKTLTVDLYDNRFTVNKNVEKGALHLSIGDSENFTFLDSFDSSLELLYNATSLIGDEFDYYKGENRICLQNEKNICMMSVIQ